MSVFSLCVMEGVCFSLIMQYTSVQYFSSVAHIFIGLWGGDPTSVVYTAQVAKVYIIVEGWLPFR